MGGMSIIWTNAKWMKGMEIGESYWWVRDNIKVLAEILSIESEKETCTVKYRRVEYLDKT